MSDDRHYHTGTPPSAPCSSVQDDLHAWALGALDAADRDLIDRHLATCPVCQAEAERWTHVASLLPFALEPSTPRLDVRDALMNRIANEQLREIPPAVPPIVSHEPASPPSSGRRLHWSQMVVAPLVVALLVMTGWAFELRDQVDNLEGGQEPTARVSDAMMLDGVQTFSMKPECDQCASTGRLLANPHTATALLIAWNLDPSMVHEIWCVEKNGAKSMVANLDVSSSGDVVQPILFDSAIEGYSEIYVMSKDDQEAQMMEMDETPMSTPPPDPDEQ